MLRHALWLSAAASLLAPSARAQGAGPSAEGGAAAPSEPGPPPPPPAYDAPPPAVGSRGVRTHDGFYLRLQLGGGYGAFDGEVESGGRRGDLEGGGFAASGGIMLGGTPAPGLVLGGAMAGHNVLRPRYSSAPSVDGSPPASIGLVYFFADYFPDPRKGLHFGGGGGLATFSYAQDEDDPYGINTLGAGGAVWAGYDFWVGKQWSLGADVRLLGARTWEAPKDPERSVTAYGGALLFTALYH